MNCYNIPEVEGTYVDIRKQCIAYEQLDTNSSYYTISEIAKIINCNYFDIDNIFKNLRLYNLKDSKWQKHQTYHEDILTLINQFLRL